MVGAQTFYPPNDQTWQTLEELPGVQWLSLAVPAPGGSIHKARLGKDTIIPAHAHPGDEFVLVLSGIIETGGVTCAAGTFWTTPGGVRQRPHVAIDDVEILTVRMGPMGRFEALA